MTEPKETKVPENEAPTSKAPKKRGAAMTAARWLISPGNPLPPGTMTHLRNIKTGRKNLKALKEIQKARYEIDKDKSFNDFVLEFNLTEDDLQRIRSVNLKYSKIYLGVFSIFTSLALWFVASESPYYAMLPLIVAYVMLTLFSLSSLRAFQIKYKSLLGFTHWLSNPGEWF